MLCVYKLMCVFCINLFIWNVALNYCAYFIMVSLYTEIKITDRDHSQ